jgi:hypothetical protein
MKVWSNIKIAVRVALRMDMNPARDDWHDLYDRIRSLMAAYTASCVAGLQRRGSHQDAQQAGSPCGPGRHLWHL